MKLKLSLFLLFLSLLSLNSYAATYYVATDGNNSSSGSIDQPFLTISYGISKLSSGDTLIVKNGIYYDLANFIKDVPSGTPGKYTTIKAMHPLEVRIKNTKTLDYYDRIISVEGNYVKIDGLIAEIIDTRYPPFIANVSGNYNKVTRSIFKRKGIGDTYGGWLSLTGNYNLAEDVAGVGNARYGFYTGGGKSAVVNHNIFRRAVGRVDYSESGQPKAVFAMYGNDDGTSAEYHLFQNCIALDSHRGPNYPDVTYGGFYFPKNANETHIQGSISLNNDVAYAGYFIKELKGQNISIEHSVSWGNYNSENNAYGIRFGGSYGPLMIDHITSGGHNHGWYNNSSSEQSMLNSIFFYEDKENNNSTSYYWTEFLNNLTQNVTGLKNTDLPVQYIIVPPNASQGADVTKRYGVDGTLWGEAGYNERTDVDLWPWPFEDKIKEVFAEENPAPEGATPSTNNAKRGFAVDGLDSWGKPLTLTRYIWQYLGNEIPSGIYKAMAVPPPNINATIKTNN